MTKSIAIFKDRSGPISSNESGLRVTWQQNTAVVTAPVPVAVEHALSEFIRAHHDELKALLDPLGFDADVLLMPEWKQMLTPELLSELEWSD